MRKLVVTENITVDGVIDASGGWFDPAGAVDGVEIDTSDIEVVLREEMKRQDTRIMGRETFEAFRGYWPKQTNDSTGITVYLNHVSKYVISSTLDDPQWENTTVLRDNLAEEVKKLKEQPGGEMGVTGSISVVHQLINAAFVDEYRLFVYPVVIGKGRRLFPDNTAKLNLNLLEAKQFRSGISLLHYQVNH